MSGSRSGPQAGVAAAALALVSAACAGPSGHGGEEASVFALIERSDETLELEGDRFEGSFPAGTEAVLVEGYGGRPDFFVRARAGRIEEYPCSSCHVGTLSRMPAPSRDAQDAHWDLELRHATEQVMTCTTCHADGDPDALTTLGGERVSFDHGYRVCVQCHSTQGNDWAGGAHGKREGGWTPPRIIQSCVPCHDPHRPQWDTRWPARAQRTERP